MKTSNKLLLVLTVTLMLLAESARAYYEPVMGRWLTRDPIGENGGINLYEFVGDNPISSCDFFGLCNCEQMSKDIEGFKKVRDQLGDMFTNWQPGQTFKNYGLGSAANAAGYRAPDFKNYSDCTQAIMNGIEGDWGVTIGFGLQLGLVGAAGYYTLGLHGTIHDTSAAEQWWMTHNRIENARNELLLKRLQDKYNEDCRCSLQRIKELN